jgi:GntR family transcriptional regulator
MRNSTVKTLSDRLDLFRIDKDNPVPIYLQLVDRILSGIEQQSIPQGSVLPPEGIICKHIGISKMTLRHAYSVLERKGYIEARQGRGTFVRGGRIEKKLPGMLSFSEEMKARGGKPSSRLIGLTVGPASHDVQSFFGIGAGEPVYEMKRLRFNDDLPLAIEVVQLPQKLFPGIDKFHWESESLYSVMERSYGIKLSRCDSEILAAPATKEQASLLNLSPGSPLIVINRRSYSDQDVPVEFSITCYSGNCYSVTFTAIREP